MTKKKMKVHYGEPSRVGDREERDLCAPCAAKYDADGNWIGSIGIRPVKPEMVDSADLVLVPPPLVEEQLASIERNRWHAPPTWVRALVSEVRIMRDVAVRHGELAIEYDERCREITRLRLALRALRGD